MAPAVVVDDVWKRFRLFHERNQYLKAAILRGRRAQYEEFWALKGISFEVNEGEFFGVVGANGSGKSTLLKCLSRILQPDRGTVAVNGRVSALLELGAGFHPELSGRENVYLNGAILGLNRRDIDRRFDEIVQFAGLERFIDTPVKNYSSGMYVRLGFAVAINVDPEVLLIDEVLAVGDASFQQRCMEKFADFKDDGRTMLIVTHDLGSVRTMCDRAAWIQYGELREVGVPADVVDDYSGDSLASRVPGSGTEARWGSGELQINAVSLHGAHGAPLTTVRTGDAMTVRLDYTAHIPIAQPVFSVAVSQLGGAVVTAPNTREAGDVPAVLASSGQVEVTFPELPLLPGTFELSVAAHDFNLFHCYDSRQHVLRFEVTRGDPVEENGVVTFGPKWSIEPDRPASARDFDALRGL
jgi:ABC-2 type transport system ATP-binding protein